jgi:glycosyltransferase involved in cell wall biosynthesis
MRIVVDCRYTRFDRHDGISRYTAGLVTELGKLHPVIMLISDHRQLALLPDLPWQLASAPTSIREPLVAHQVNRLRPDVVFSPMQTMGSWGRRYRLILTVHDLIYYSNRTPPRDFPAAVRLLWRLYHLAWWPQRMLLNRADAIVTVSETTGDLIRKHHLTRRPVIVVPNAPDALGREPVRREAAEAGRLVYMGSFMPYKNVDTLVRAVADLPQHELHLMSRIGEPERARLAALAPRAKLVFHNGASDEEYASVLRGATALVTASLDEGFGIPLVEAMSQGIPIVVSDIPIFREIGGEAALYFPPNEPGALVTAIIRLDQPGEWAERSRRSVIEAGRFTWADSARTLLTLIAATATAAGPAADPGQTEAAPH